jgi:CRP-like cAMP-binding protein
MYDFDSDIIKFGFEGEEALTDEILKKYGKSFNEKDIIINEGEKSNSVFYLLEGRCWVCKKIGDKYKVLNIIRKGEIFGEMSLFDIELRSATVIAMDTPTKCLIFPKEDFIELFKLHPRWVDTILRNMSKRIINMIEKLN